MSACPYCLEPTGDVVAHIEANHLDHIRERLATADEARQKLSHIGPRVFAQAWPPQASTRRARSKGPTSE